MHLLKNMGHQDLTLLYVWRELILYCSPNCVYHSNTDKNSVMQVSSQLVSQQSEQVESPKPDDLYKKRPTKF